jgi:hypothetical protein
MYRIVSYVSIESGILAGTRSTDFSFGRCHFLSMAPSPDGSRTRHRKLLLGPTYSAIIFGVAYLEINPYELASKVRISVLLPIWLTTANIFMLKSVRKTLGDPSLLYLQYNIKSKPCQVCYGRL